MAPRRGTLEWICNGHLEWLARVPIFHVMHPTQRVGLTRYWGLGMARTRTEVGRSTGGAAVVAEVPPAEVPDRRSTGIFSEYSSYHQYFS
ncbi:MAG: hypothetical protein GY696_24570 [Gammaproteobacteria bacterium]|nr:hypothetical protein [Gammaproteobacteria bacterium]